MSRRTVVSIAAALALAPLTVFAADKAPSGHMDHTNCECARGSKGTTMSPGRVDTYQGATQAELERIWAPVP